MSDLDIIEAPLPDEPAPEPVSETEPEKPEEPETPETPEEQAEEPEEAPGDDEAEEEERPKKRPRRNLQKRISQITRQRNEAQQQAAQLKQQLEAVQTRSEPQAEPKQEDFQSFDDFVVARAEFRAREALKEELQGLSANAQAAQQQAEHTARTADWSLKVEEARDKYDDFDEVAQNPDLPVSQAMAQAIQEADNGADVAYHLGRNPTLARELSGLPPTQAVLRIGQLSQKLGEKPRPKPTAAPDPVKPLKTTSVTPQKSPDDMSMAEYVEWRRKGGK